MLDEVKMRLISQLIKGSSGVLRKLLKYFNGTTISTSFIPFTLPVLPNVSCLNLNEALLLAAWKLATVPASVKAGSSR